MKSNTIKLKTLICLALLWGTFSSLSAQSSQQKVLKHVVSFQFKEEVSEERKTQAKKTAPVSKMQIQRKRQIESFCFLQRKIILKRLLTRNQ